MRNADDWYPACWPDLPRRTPDICPSRAGNFGGGGGDAGDLQLPKATVFRAIKDALPDGLRCSSETGNLVMECCMELLKMVCDEVEPATLSCARLRRLSRLCVRAMQAMQISTGDGKSTIGDSHVQRAVESLGFKPEWRECLQRALAVRVYVGVPDCMCGCARQDAFV